jgi:chromosome segregation ATPase
MEPFVIEEFIGFVILAGAGGYAVFILVKTGVVLWMIIRSRPAAPQNPRTRIAGVIAESEARLASMREMIEDVRGTHLKLQSNAEAAQRETAKLRDIEEVYYRTSAGNVALRAIVRQRLEAEEHERTAAGAAASARTALDDIERRHGELERKIVGARAVMAALEARMAAAEIKQDIHDDLFKGTDAAIDALEEATVASESRAESYEETSRLLSQRAAGISDDDVAAEMARKGDAS